MRTRNTFHKHFWVYVNTAATAAAAASNVNANKRTRVEKIGQEKQNNTNKSSIC